MKVSRLGVIALAVLATLPIGAQEQTAPPPATPEGLVLETEQIIEFDTDEVTWMSVDVSPDGRTMVFDLLGDLYTLPIEGGSATRIVGGLSFESQPTWSPDGKTIAFLTDRTGIENLWIADADGANPRNVTIHPAFDGWPSWSPDGRRIAFASNRHSSYQIWVMDAGGGNPQLVANTEGRATVPRWSPDGRRIV